MMKIWSFIFFAALIPMTSAYASVVIMGTRVIYPAQQKSINVQLNNNESEPSLIQSWIDTGDAKSAPDSVKVPFIIYPPVFRMEPKSGQTLRIIYTQEKLPVDRESLFYLNVLDIPAKPDVKETPASGKNTNYLQLAVRSRIKFFFRPDDLKYSPSDAYGQVRWSSEQQSSQTIIRADNQTPYFITYNRISLMLNGKEYPVEHPGMVAPYTSMTFSLGKSVPSGGSVLWTVINDFGGYQKGKSILK